MGELEDRIARALKSADGAPRPSPRLAERAMEKAATRARRQRRAIRSIGATIAAAVVVVGLVVSHAGSRLGGTFATSSKSGAASGATSSKSGAASGALRCSGPAAGGLTVPDLIGLSLPQATTAIQALHLKVYVASAPAAATPGRVTAEEPASGSAVAPGSTVRLTLGPSPSDSQSSPPSTRTAGTPAPTVPHCQTGAPG